MSSWFKQQIQETTEALKKTAIKARNKAFMEAAIAGFVAVGYADGVLKPEAKDKMLGFIKNSEALSVFDQAEIQECMDKYIQHYGFDPVSAEANALGVIGKLKDRESEARLLVRICIVIGAADGALSERETGVVRKICAALGLNPQDFDFPNTAGRSEQPRPPPPPAPAAPGLSLSRGGRIALRQQDPTLNSVQVGLGWKTEPGYDLDTAAFMLNAQGRVRSDADFIFYNQRLSPCGAVAHQGEPADRTSDRQLLRVELDRVPVEIQRIAFTVTIHEAEARRQCFAQVRNASIRLVNADSGAELVRYELANDAADETALIFGELYRHSGDWRFSAVGQGYVGGLAALCQRFGVNV